MATNKVVEKSRKSSEWKSKDGRGFRITEMSGGKTDILFFKGNKAVAHLSLDVEMMKALADKIKNFA